MTTAIARFRVGSGVALALVMLSSAARAQEASVADGTLPEAPAPVADAKPDPAADAPSAPEAAAPSALAPAPVAAPAPAPTPSPLPTPEEAALDAAIADLGAPKPATVAATVPAPAPVPVPAPAAPAPPAKPCSLAEHRQFDYWIGEWDVFAVGSPRLVANSRIEAKYGGCAIRENWMPMNRNGGGSLNSYDVRMGKWRQTWVDSTGAWVLFEGGMVDGAMELMGIWRDYGGPGNDPLIKMRYEKKPDGTVRQWGQQSNDGGITWSTSFDLIYKRRTVPLQP